MWPPIFLPWKRLLLEALHPRVCLFLARGQHFVGPVSHVPRGAMKLVAGWCSGTRCCQRPPPWVGSQRERCSLPPSSDEAKGCRERYISPIPHLNTSSRVSEITTGCQSTSPTHHSSVQLRPASPHIYPLFPARPWGDREGWGYQGAHAWHLFVLLSFCSKPREQHPCKPSLGAGS